LYINAVLLMTTINHPALTTHHRISVLKFVISNAMILRNK